MTWVQWGVCVCVCFVFHVLFKDSCSWRLSKCWPISPAGESEFRVQPPIDSAAELGYMLYRVQAYPKNVKHFFWICPKATSVFTIALLYTQVGQPTIMYMGGCTLQLAFPVGGKGTGIYIEQAPLPMCKSPNYSINPMQACRTKATKWIKLYLTQISSFYFQRNVYHALVFLFCICLIDYNSLLIAVVIFDHSNVLLFLVHASGKTGKVELVLQKKDCTVWKSLGMSLEGNNSFVKSSQRGQYEAD